MPSERRHRSTAGKRGIVSRSLRGVCAGFGRVGDLSDDLDDVPIRIEDATLAVGAVAAGEDLADPFELTFGAELARMWLDVAQRSADELRDRDAVAATGRKVHH